MKIKDFNSIQLKKHPNENVDTSKPWMFSSSSSKRSQPSERSELNSRDVHDRRKKTGVALMSGSVSPDAGGRASWQLSLLPFKRSQQFTFKKHTKESRAPQPKLCVRVQHRRG